MQSFIAKFVVQLREKLVHTFVTLCRYHVLYLRQFGSFTLQGHVVFHTIPYFIFPFVDVMVRLWNKICVTWQNLLVDLSMLAAALLLHLQFIVSRNLQLHFLSVHRISEVRQSPATLVDWCCSCSTIYRNDPRIQVSLWVKVRAWSSVWVTATLIECMLLASQPCPFHDACAPSSISSHALAAISDLVIYAPSFDSILLLSTFDSHLIIIMIRCFS